MRPTSKPAACTRSCSAFRSTQMVTRRRPGAAMSSSPPTRSGRWRRRSESAGGSTRRESILASSRGRTSSTSTDTCSTCRMRPRSSPGSSNPRIALGLADALLVERHRRVIERLVSEIVDYVFANEREILALTGAKDVKQALLSVGRPGLVVAVTRGGEGATLGSEDGIVDLRAHEVDKVVDVTGAGDLFAAGFCFGVTHGHDPVSAARLGMIAASEVIGHLGARPETSLAELARLQGLL